MNIPHAGAETKHPKTNRGIQNPNKKSQEQNILHKAATAPKWGTNLYPLRRESNQALSSKAVRSYQSRARARDQGPRISQQRTHKARNYPPAILASKRQLQPAFPAKGNMQGKMGS